LMFDVQIISDRRDKNVGGCIHTSLFGPQTIICLPGMKRAILLE